MNVLVTGGAGYIGSHAAKRLLEAGHKVVVVDSMFRATRGNIERLAGHPSAPGNLVFHEADVNDANALGLILRGHPVDAVMHFAGVAYVGESVRDPLLYHRVNGAGTLAVLEACARFGIPRLVFSSSCVTYGDPGPALLPVREDCPQRPANPYGWSKLAAERMLTDFAAACTGPTAVIPGFSCASLRYFNVAGCDRDGLLGHEHNPETRVIPLCLRAAMGVDPVFTVFGDDYPPPGSPDGTAVRDYIHVDDLVRAHLLVLGALRPGDGRVYNLGTGVGVSVRQIVRSVERVTGRAVPVKVGPRRPGDPASLFCSPERIGRELGWKAEVTDLDEIVRSSWEWMSRTL